MTKSTTIQDLSLADLTKRVDQVRALIDQVEAALPGLVTLTDAERYASDGRLRDGEVEALASVLDVADAHAASFAVLADKDDGKDPKRFETALLRDRLGRSAALDGLATLLEELARDVRDTQLVMGGASRRVVLAAYEIAKPLAKHDDKARSLLAPALGFYGAAARQAAKTRAQKKAEKQAADAKK